MRLVGKIKKASPTGKTGEFELDVEIVDVVSDIVKVSPRLKGKSISLRRFFREGIPSPCEGEFIVLDGAETSRSLAQIAELPSRPCADKGEVVYALDDFDGDGYEEIFMANSFVELMASPRRGGCINKLAVVGENGLLADDNIFSVEGKIIGGIYLADRKSEILAPDKISFKPRQMKVGEVIKKTGPHAFEMRAGANGMKMSLSFGLCPNSPVLRVTLDLDNSGKKSRSKLLSLNAVMNFVQSGRNNCDIALLEPSGEENVFSRRLVFWMGELAGRWIHYRGNVKSGGAGFFIVRRRKEEEALLVAYDPAKIARIWMDRFALMPHSRVLWKTKRIAKNGKFSAQLLLVPLTKFAVKNRRMLGFSRGRGCSYIVYAGIGRAKVQLKRGSEVEDVSLDKLGKSLRGASVDEAPDEIVLQGGELSLRVGV